MARLIPTQATFRTRARMARLPCRASATPSEAKTSAPTSGMPASRAAITVSCLTARTRTYWASQLTAAAAAARTASAIIALRSQAWARSRGVAAGRARGRSAAGRGVRAGRRLCWRDGSGGGQRAAQVRAAMEAASLRARGELRPSCSCQVRRVVGSAAPGTSSRTWLRRRRRISASCRSRAPAVLGDPRAQPRGVRLGHLPPPGRIRSAVT